MKITELPDSELLRLVQAVGRSETVEPALVEAVHDELARRLEAAGSRLRQHETDYHEAVHQQIVQAGRRAIEAEQRQEADRQ